MAEGCNFLVLMCTHNGERHLQEQLESIAGQTLKPRKLIVHDWGSTDGTVEAIRRFALGCRGVLEVELVAHDDAPGPQQSFSNAIVECIEHEHFDFLLLSDQDDVWMPEKVATLAASTTVAGGGGPDICLSDVVIINEQGKPLRSSFYDRNSPFLQPQSCEHASILLTNPAIGMTMCISRGFLEEVKGLVRGAWVMHDWTLMILAAALGRKISYVPVALVKYRQHAANQLGASERGRLWRKIRKARAHVGWLRAQVETLARCDINLQPEFRRLVAASGAVRYLAVIRLAFGSPILRAWERAQLAFALALFWRSKAN